MKEVAVAYEVEVSADELREALSPVTIVEAAGMYEITDRESTPDGTWITVVFEETELELEFVETDGGYEYTVVDGADLFAHRHTSVVVDDVEPTRIVGTTTYTFDSIWSFLLDRLGKKTVRHELEATVHGLVEEAVESGDVGGADFADPSTDEPDPSNE